MHSRGSYGVSGMRWADTVNHLATMGRCATVLDYGSGQGVLAQALPSERSYRVIEYDPALPDKEEHPTEPADLVFCGDVLEHIEPFCLEVVIDDICALTGKMVMLVVATVPASKLLADGRNAHLIVEPLSWWLPRLVERWVMERVSAAPTQFQFFGTPK